MLYQVPLALLHHAAQCRTRFGAETLQDVAVILSAPEDYVESLGEEARRILACAQQIRRERWRRVCRAAFDGQLSGFLGNRFAWCFLALRRSRMLQSLAKKLSSKVKGTSITS